MGPLQGIRVIELQGIGPGPFCGMMLSDMGAEVIRIDRAGNVSGVASDGPPIDVLARGRSSIGVDLKNPEGVEVVLRLIETADALIEGFRPGVMERFGSRRMFCSKSATCLWAYDWMGSRRPLCHGCRARYQLHSFGRCP